jgi:glycosyltransferase involved in cell wall biosynthesis
MIYNRGQALTLPLEVSVIIPTYNRRAMVREAVASVLAQREVDCELIVIDDGSSDGTAEELALIAALDAPAAGVAMSMQYQPNRGVSAARNTGVRAARADLVAFLDSDDLWAPDKLKHQVSFMRNNPACQIAQTGELWMRGGRRVNPSRRHQKRSGNIFRDSLRTCLISPSAVIMRTALFRAMGGFDESLIAAEDYDLWLRISRDYPVGLIDKALVIRRAGHQGQLSAEVPALDRFRIMTLLKLLASPTSPTEPPACAHEYRRAICEVLTEKCRIYAKGLSRRGQASIADAVLQLARDAERWREHPVDASGIKLNNAFALFRALIGHRASAEEGQRLHPVVSYG